jgi:hypothetical protein
VLVAVRSFITSDPYNPEIRVIAARTRVAERSDLHRRFPKHFTPVESECGAARQTIRAGGTSGLRIVDRRTRPRGFEPWRLPTSAPNCRLDLDRQSTTRVRLTPAIRDRLPVEDWQADGEREIGSTLSGVASPELIEVLSIGPLVIGERHRLRLDFSDAARAVGDLHTHPDALLLPSVRDLLSWSRLRRGLGVSRWLGLIATRVASGWAMAAWIVRDEGSHDVAERARLV